MHMTATVLVPAGGEVVVDDLGATEAELNAEHRIRQGDLL